MYYKNIRTWRILSEFFPVAYEKKLLPRRKQDIASDFCFNRYQLSPLTTRWPFCFAKMSLHMIQNKEWRHYQQNDSQSQGCHGGHTMGRIRVIQDRKGDKSYHVTSGFWWHHKLHYIESRMKMPFIIFICNVFLHEGWRMWNLHHYIAHFTIYIYKKCFVHDVDVGCENCSLFWNAQFYLSIITWKFSVI